MCSFQFVFVHETDVRELSPCSRYLLVNKLLLHRRQNELQRRAREHIPSKSPGVIRVGGGGRRLML